MVKLGFGTFSEHTTAALTDFVLGFDKQNIWRIWHHTVKILPPFQVSHRYAGCPRLKFCVELKKKNGKYGSLALALIPHPWQYSQCKEV